MAAGEFGEDAAGLGEADVRALADGLVAEGLGDVCLPDANGAEQNYGSAGVEPAQGSEVADLGGGRLRGGVEVEALQGGWLLELGFAQAVFERGGLAAGDLVVSEDLEEVEVSEFAFLGLSEAGVEGFEHAGQLQGLEGIAQGGGHHAHRATFSASSRPSSSWTLPGVWVGTVAANRPSGPCRKAEAPASPVSGSGSVLVPATGMPSTVR